MPDQTLTSVTPAATGTSRLARLAIRTMTAVATGCLVLGGVWVTGGVLTDDAYVAKALTGAWFVVSGAAAVLLARGRRDLALPVLAGWVLTSAASGAFLFVTSTVDRVVHEEVVMAASAPPGAGAVPDGPLLRADGRFTSGAHRTVGRAALVRTADGGRVVTLTGFSTAPGPDLRVYAVPHRSGLDGAVDLGSLKGNKGDQQYVVPPTTRIRSVVVWCRAFSVEFGRAVLRVA